MRRTLACATAIGPARFALAFERFGIEFLEALLKPRGDGAGGDIVENGRALGAGWRGRGCGAGQLLCAELLDRAWVLVYVVVGLAQQVDCLLSPEHGAAVVEAAGLGQRLLGAGRASGGI